MNRLENMKRFNTREGLPPQVLKPKAMLSLQDRCSALYLVNESCDVLDIVKAEPWGFCGKLTLNSNSLFQYENVQPMEGVLVYEPLEDSDIYYSDFVTGLYVYIKSKQFGNIRITPKSSKKGVVSQALIYEDFTVARRVIMSAWH